MSDDATRFTATLSPAALAALRNTPTDEEIDALDDQVQEWANSEDATEPRPELQEQVAAISARMVATRAAIYELLASVEDSAPMTPEQMAAAMDQWGQVAEFVTGYKAKMVAAGFAPEHAEVAALQLHSVIMASGRTTA